MEAKKIVLVTGANTGIGYALCKLLVTEHDCDAILCARDAAKGESALKALIEVHPECKGRISVVQLDVTKPDVVKSAAATVKDQLGDKKLYGIVNNAGTGLAHEDTTMEDIVAVNIYGVKNVTEAFLPLLDGKCGRIVILGSGLGCKYTSELEDGSTKDMLSKDVTDWKTLEDYTKKALPSLDKYKTYGLSKAVVCKYGEIIARENPALFVSTVSPGFINTNLCKGYGAKLTPEDGTKSTRHCLFSTLGGSGYFFASDCVRAPLHEERSAGGPEFKGY